MDFTEDVKPIIKEEIGEFSHDVNLVYVKAGMIHTNDSDEREDEMEDEPTSDPLASIPIDHESFNSEGPETTCPICQKSFDAKNKHYLKRHIATVHYGNRPYPCSRCGKSFKKHDHLQRHILLIHDETRGRPYACEKCDKTFKLETQLQIHSKVHDEARTMYTCSICNTSYWQRRSLIAHQQIHEPKPDPMPGHNVIIIKDKKFTCSVCNTSFTERKYLRSHELQMHERTTPFSCTKCTRSFKWRQNLRRHTLLVHTGENQV